MFHTKWMNNNGILYKNNNEYLIIKSDGLDPVFGQLSNFVLSVCNVLFYDDHYHAYVVQLLRDHLYYNCTITMFTMDTN